MIRTIPDDVNIILKKVVDGANIIFDNRLKKVILYGSYARGDYNEHSDIDIMILTDLNNDEIGEYQDKIWDYAYDIEEENEFAITVSILVKNIDRFNYWLEALPFYKNVQDEGVILSEC